MSDSRNNATSNVIKKGLAARSAEVKTSIQDAKQSLLGAIKHAADSHRPPVEMRTIADKSDINLSKIVIDDYDPNGTKPKPLTESAFFPLQNSPNPIHLDMPKKAKPQDTLKFIAPPSKTSFHSTQRAVKKNKPNTLRFF